MKARVCPQCGSHNQTDAWRCEGCGGTLSISDLQEVDVTAPEQDQIEQAPEPEAPPEPQPAALEPSLPPPQAAFIRTEPMPLGPRIAGGVLIVNALMALAGVALKMESAFNVSPIVPALIDILVGAYLIKGSWSMLPWAKIRVGLGAVVYGALSAADGDFISLGAIIAFSASLLLLLFGEPKRLRISISLVVIGLVFLLNLFGFQQALTGTNLLGEAYNRLTYKISPSEDTIFTGTLVDYTIGPLDPDWMRRDDAAAKVDNPLADLWLVNPKYDGHIIVVPEILPVAGMLDLETYTDAAIALTEQGLEDFELVARTPFNQGLVEGNVADLTGMVEDLRLRFRIGLFVQERYYVQIGCFSLEVVFHRIEDSCDAALRSFQFGSNE